LADFEEILEAERIGDDGLRRRSAERFFRELSNVPQEDMSDHLVAIRNVAERRGGASAREEFSSIVAGIEDSVLPTSRAQLQTSVEKFIAGELTEGMLLKLVEIARRRRLISAEEIESFQGLLRMRGQTNRGVIPEELEGFLDEL